MSENTRTLQSVTFPGGPPALLILTPVWLGLVLFGVVQFQREQPKAAGQLALPGGLGTLELRQTAEGAASVVDRQGHEVVAILRCSTTSFALLDDDDKAYAVQAWSRVQTAMAYLDLIAAAGAAMSHELLVCLVIDMSKALRRIRDAGGDLTGLEHVVRSEIEALATGLKTHGVTVDEWLPDNKVTAVMRGAFDPQAVTRLAAAGCARPSQSVSWQAPRRY